jgi:membrane-associated protease RseP (regulator of RpoE activity)
VWSFRFGETEYGVKALPVGGFVKIIGMTSMDQVDPEDEPRSFRRQPGWQRVIVLCAGSFMHFLLAAVLIFGLAMAIGIENDNTTQLATIGPCVPANSHAVLTGAACPPSAAKSPAALAGFKVGDKVTSFDGMRVTSFTQLSGLVKAEPGRPATFTVDRDGKTVTLHAKLADVPKWGGYLGIGTSDVFQPTSVLGAVKYVGTGFAQEVEGAGQALGQVPAEIPKLFSKSTGGSSGSGVTSTVGIAEVTGQAVAANVGWEYKVSFVLLIIASVNIFVGIFNLLPLLPLDGGHVAMVIWEMIRTRIARLRRRPDPGLVDYTKVIPVSLSIFAVLVVFGVALMISNVINPVNIG